MTIPVLFRNHFQMGYVVRDMDGAIETLGSRFGVKAWRVLDLPEDAEVRRLGFAYVQEMMLELVEMRPGSEMFFKPWIPKVSTALQLNHLGYMMSSEQEWDLVSRQFEAAGFPIAVARSLGDVRFTYYDTVAELGHYCEITYLGPGAKNFFEAPRN